MTHKVRLLDRQGRKVYIIEVRTNVLAGRAILRDGDRWYVFGGIVGDKYADFDFREVEAPYALRVPIADNLSTDADAIAAYDEPGSWGRLSEGWPETPYNTAKWLLCTKAHVVPYGQYVVVGSKPRTDPKPHVQPGGYDYSEAVIRVASVELLEKLEKAYRGMFVECAEILLQFMEGKST